MKLAISSILLGFFAAYSFGPVLVEDAVWYEVLVYVLLGVGLYLSTHDIDLDEFRTTRSIVILAVTVGVLFKIALIGLALYFVTGKVWFFLVAVVVAQIDPLSVAALMSRRGSEVLSNRAKTILRAWSSFDDPMTVLASIYIASVLVLPGHAPFWEAYGDQALALGLNIALPMGVYLFMKLGRIPRSAENLILLVLLAVAVYFRLMLGIAIVGLIFRPRLLFSARMVTQAAYAVSLFLVGMLLARGASIVEGVMVGICAILAQAIVAWALTRHLPVWERLYLALAQQNGITAVLLALLFEDDLPGIVGIVIPAVIFINFMHYCLNSAFDRVSRPAMNN